ncbi:DUF3426 domain-containing protein [Pusillimonas sp. MFBS29]|uniref:zinc-ribbon and DUF3426 domain-containing protein n=1 Tax=Pusillimonas sp. MFBS29 TaxID=2886690 RepID=UPI001D12D7DD|nr:zinc-ribbon and DUF3426 domain-containing protein [Pusillimonas sp. MFBS29]MCC2597051.1 DUF3426 domain-containing protein [Pusillimonas sp. MFBS29]
MDLTTRCPECGTTFSASLAQLQLRKGYIRCVKCAHIFDGYEAVVSTGAGATASPAAPRDPVVHHEPSLPSVPAVPKTTQTSHEPSLPSVLRQRPVSANEPVHHISATKAETDSAFTISTPDDNSTQASGPAPAFHLGEGHDRTRPEPTLGSVHSAAAESVDPVVHSRDGREELRVSGLYVEPRRDSGGSRHPDKARGASALEHDGAHRGSMGRLLWGVLVLLGVLLLLAQLVYVYRAPIANNVPALRPVLENACVSLECRIPYARQIDQIAIMSSSLRSGTPAAAVAAAAPDAAAKGDDAPVMLLQLVLRNNYDKPQEWPTLVLDLTDLSGTRVARKNLPPQSYLPAEILSGPFRAGSEISIEVPIVMKEAKVNGYQLDKFFH